MKLKEISKLGLSPKTIDEIYVDPTQLISSDEFNTKYVTITCPYCSTQMTTTNILLI